MSGLTPRFEGSYMGDAARLADDAVMECKICWSVYDPAEGCEVWQVPPHTPFSSLPDYWRCPTCDGAKEQFMVVSASPLPPAPEKSANTGSMMQTEQKHTSDPASSFARALEEVFTDIYASKMRGLPFVNEALHVKAVGFCTFEGQLVGALVTPWFMNLIALPSAGADWSGVVSGSKKLLNFPSGSYEFTAVLRDEGTKALPGYWACSLFSPVFNFTTMLQAIDTAQAAVRGLLDPALNPQSGAAHTAKHTAQADQLPEKPDMGRRSLLVGRPTARAGA
ncbi:[NiFe]-hydrogenase assembly chaperone HybE [Acetobacter okinawensis]|uniref:[NiFe]-hydrogenase assembly chaperone HybE n=1 Tax=Acetobacter okinawensis TaxID=1076594 RepID=UPI001BA7A37F|nr:[NiFe]-hydrogenase assembly chaperone HybE [Acetobacter okinawensis]MBS0987760.1 [NiFe]-hydrogenase assembly chaperone HybE [Acetobacter okinawensis]